MLISQRQRQASTPRSRRTPASSCSAAQPPQRLDVIDQVLRRDRGQVDARLTGQRPGGRPRSPAGQTGSRNNGRGRSRRATTAVHPNPGRRAARPPAFPCGFPTRSQETRCPLPASRTPESRGSTTGYRIGPLWRQLIRAAALRAWAGTTASASEDWRPCRSAPITQICCRHGQHRHGQVSIRSAGRRAVIKGTFATSAARWATGQLDIRPPGLCQWPSYGPRWWPACIFCIFIHRGHARKCALMPRQGFVKVAVCCLAW